LQEIKEIEVKEYKKGLWIEDNPIDLIKFRKLQKVFFLDILNLILQ